MEERNLTRELADGIVKRKGDTLSRRVSRLHSFEMLHEEGFSYLADNSYIRSGYRLNYSIRDCILSLFQLHNETLNVWTHMIGSFIFIGLLGYWMWHDDATSPTVPMSLFYKYGIQSNPSIEELRLQKWCVPKSNHGLFVENGRHTKHMLLTEVTQDACSQLQYAYSAEKPSMNIYQVASTIFEQCLHQIPTLQRFYQSLEENAEEFSQTILSNVESLREELLIVKKRLSDITSNSTSSILPESFQHVQKIRQNLEEHVEIFSNLLKSAAYNVGADVPLQYAVEELHELMDSVTNGVKVLSATNGHHVPHWPIYVFMISAVICLTCSAVFHLLFVYSKPAYFLLSRLDYAGITIMIAGSFYPLVYYAFYCHPWILRIYLTAITIMAALTFTISLIPAFGSPKYLFLRTSIFLGLGFFGIFPISHLIWQFGIFDPHVTVTIGPLVLMAVLYIAGAIIYATRFPERFYPGRFDVWFSSHQLWHICVVAAALVHFLNARQHYNWRWNTQCDA